jgi:uncharacterized protein involved in exopolysaccharide biosynthesis
MEQSLTSYQPEIPVGIPPKLRWRDVRFFLKRYWGILVCVFATTVLGTYTTLCFLTEKYETEAAVIVKLGRENVDPPPTARNTNVFSGIRREEVLSEIEFMRSPDLIRAVVRDIGPEAFTPIRVMPNDLLGKVKFHAKAAVRWVKEQYNEALIALNLERRLTDMEKATLAVQEDLAVVYQKDSDVISLKLRTADPALARRVLSRVLDLYTSRRIEIKQTGGTEEFLISKTSELRRRLEALETSKLEWKQARDVTSAQDQKSLLLRQIRDLSAEHDGTLRELAAYEQQAEATRRLIATTPDQLRSSHQEAPDPSSTALKQRLTAVQSERAHLLAKFEPSAPQVQAVDQEIATVRELIRAAKSTEVASVTYQVNPLRQELERKLQETNIALQGLRSRDALQQKQLTALGMELRNIDIADSGLQAIERERQLAETEYMALVKRKQEADIDMQLDRKRISNISILTPPTSGFEPVYPRKMLLMGVALLMGLVLGMGLSLLLNYMDDHIHTPEAAESVLRLPCLGTVEGANP